MGGGAVGRGGGTEWLREVVHGGHRELHGGVWDGVGAEGPVGGAKARGGRMSGLLRGLARGRARRGREEGEAWSAVLYGGSLTVPRAKAAGTRGRGVPGDGAWHWDVRAPDTVSTPPIGSARALSSGASHPAPSPWVELGSTQVLCCVVLCCVVLCCVVLCCVVLCCVVLCCVVLCCVVLCRRRCYQRAEAKMSTGTGKREGCVCRARCVRVCLERCGEQEEGGLEAPHQAIVVSPGAPAEVPPSPLAGAGIAPATPTSSCCSGPAGPSAVWRAPWRGRTKPRWTPR